MTTGWLSVDQYLQGQGVKIGAPTASQTTGGTHVSGSNHYLGNARDYGDANSNCSAVVAALLPLAQGDNAPIVELYYAGTNTFYKNGKSIAAVAGHGDHVHVAIRAGVDLSTYSPGAHVSPDAGTNTTGISGVFSTLTSADTAKRVAMFVAGGALVVAGIAILSGK